MPNPINITEYMRDSQKINKKTKITRITDEGWNSQKHLSGPVEQRKKEKTLVSSSKTLSRFSSPIGLSIYYRVGIASRKMVIHVRTQTVFLE